MYVNNQVVTYNYLPAPFEIVVFILDTDSSLFTSSRPCLAKLQVPVFSALSMCGFIEFPMMFNFNFGKVSSCGSSAKQLPIRNVYRLRKYLEFTVKLMRCRLSSCRLHRKCHLQGSYNSDEVQGRVRRTRDGLLVEETMQYL